MSSCTSFRIGGPADLLLDLRDEAQAAAALNAASALSLPVTIIGNGTNLLVRDGGIRGVVLRMAGQTADISVISSGSDGSALSVPAGVTLAQLASYACMHGLDGMVPLSGIPGALGGAVIMNAGAYGGETSQIVTDVSGIRMDGTPFAYHKDEISFGYRRSSLSDEPLLVTRVSVFLPCGETEDIRSRMNDLSRQRREKQPLEYPSAGSTFKRPVGGFAAKLIDDCGLRGFSVGGAQVSEKHAGFVINRGGATAADVLSLMKIIQKRVSDASGILLEPEVRILGED